MMLQNLNRTQLSNSLDESPGYGFRYLEIYEIYKYTMGVWELVLSLKTMFSDRGRGEYNTIMLSQSQHLLGPV